MELFNIPPMLIDKSIDIYPSGTKVSITYGCIEGVISQISISFDKVEYQITYCNSGDVKTVWLNENLFSTSESKTSIGYKS